MKFHPQWHTFYNQATPYLPKQFFWLGIKHSKLWAYRDHLQISASYKLKYIQAPHTHHSINHPENSNPNESDWHQKSLIFAKWASYEFTCRHISFFSYYQSPQGKEHLYLKKEHFSHQLSHVSLNGRISSFKRHLTRLEQCRMRWVNFEEEINGYVFLRCGFVPQAFSNRVFQTCCLLLLEIRSRITADCIKFSFHKILLISTYSDQSTHHRIDLQEYDNELVRWTGGLALPHDSACAMIYWDR